MKHLRQIAGYWAVIVGIVCMTVALAGCQSPPPDLDGPAGTPTVPVFHVGDSVTVRYSGLPTDQQMPDHSETVKEDGTITLPDVGVVKAAGKTAGTLQTELQKAYRNGYVNLTVTVLPLQTYFHVTGEVKNEGPKAYLGTTHIIQAISAAGGFTDYANKKKVQLTRAGAKKPVVINCLKALQDSRYDVQIYPGDTIYVPRRFM